MLETTTTSNEALQVLMRISDLLLYDDPELAEGVKKLTEHFRKEPESAVRVKILSLFGDFAAETSIDGIILIDEIITLLKLEKSPKVISQGLCSLHKIGQSQNIPPGHMNRAVSFAKNQLTSASHNVQRHALLVLGSFSQLADAEKETLELVGHYTDSQDARVRAQAFRAILTLSERGVVLMPTLYYRAVKSLHDDYECVRQEALELVYVLGIKHPE